MKPFPFLWLLVSLSQNSCVKPLYWHWHSRGLASLPQGHEGINGNNSVTSPVRKESCWITTLWINSELLSVALLIILNTFLDCTNKKLVWFSWDIQMGSFTDAASLFISLFMICMYTCMHVYIISCSEEGFLNTQLKAWKIQMKNSQIFFTANLPLIGSLRATFKKLFLIKNY